MTNFVSRHLVPICRMLFPLALLSCQAGQIVDVTRQDELDNVIESEFRRLQLPGVACAAVAGDSIVYSGAKGYADVEKKTPFTPQTRMSIASTTKAMTVTAVMRLYEDSLLRLDDDINSYLPFKVRHPSYPDVPITIKMLLTHTASISDYGFGLWYLYGYVDYPIPLMTFAKECLTEGGQYFNDHRFLESRPGSSTSYTNIGVALLACIVEAVSGIDFGTYCKQDIFEPLGMTQTHWFFSEVPKEELAVPYGDNNIRYPLYYSFPTYPDGGLITTVDDLSRFMRAYIMDGSFNGYQLLQLETIDLMLQVRGTFWTIIGEVSEGFLFGQRTIGRYSPWGHAGGDDGISSEMFFDREKRIGYIVFSNRFNGYSETIANALLLYADSR